MRVFMLAAVVVTVGVPSPARADGIVEVAGAVTFPIGDDNWKNTVEPSPELGIRAGGGNDELAGLIGLAWVPEQLDAQPAFTSVSGHRFRILGNLELGHHIAPKIRLGGRIGAGTDITHGSYTVMFAGTTASKSDTDFGFALDLAVSLLFDVGSVQVGPELAVPIGYHSKKAMNLGDLSFDYTQTDIELWFVVRFGSHAK
ncbi:MAG: hypothetical protein JWO36_7122 [Myxococcales bacterium]|nr:hypothetical protein [Myxococcales bacterium]